MDGETMRKSLEDILEGDAGTGRKNDFEITDEEAKKFKAAMADPEFQSMLRDYMEEMQDPEQRAEQEAYIAELEGQNLAPRGKEIVHPVPGFVIKTRFSRGCQDGEKEKLFVNVVTSPKVGKPYSKASEKTPGGESWSLPVAVGPQRMEKDRGGESTVTFDVCYHPEALVRARKLVAFREIVALSSLERVEQAFLLNTKQKMEVERSYRVLKGVPYKSGPCATMLMSKTEINKEEFVVPEVGTETTAASPSSFSEAKSEETRREHKSKANSPSREATVDAENSSKPNVATRATTTTAAAADADAETAAEAKPTDSTTEPGDIKKVSPDSEATPPSALVLGPGWKDGRGGARYKLVERGSFQIADHTTSASGRTTATISWPEHLVVTVCLPPDAVPTRKLDVVVSGRKLVVGVTSDAEDVPPRYLELPLPYVVEDDTKCCAARASNGLLMITMPVKRPPSSLGPVPYSAAAAAAAADDEDASEDEEGEQDAAVGAEDRSTADLDKTKQPDHSRWVKEAPPSEVLDKPWEALSAPGQRGVNLPPPPPDTGEVEGPEDSEFAAKISQGLEEDAPFMASDRFVRAVSGYEFKTDTQGPGYYRNDVNTKVPKVDWNETITAMCAVVQVPHIMDRSVRYAFGDGEMKLSFTARASGEEGGEEERERYRGVFSLAGGVDPSKCTHDTAEQNMMVKIVKDPQCEWETMPTPTEATATSSSATDETSEAQARVEEGISTKEAVLAPGHGGAGNAGVGGSVQAAQAELESLAFELD